MKVDVLDTTGKKASTTSLPAQFLGEVRVDVISRMLRALFANRRAPYGAKPDAGLRVSATLSRRRGAYRSAYKHGISRVPRKALWSRGTQFGWVGAEVPGTVGGRRAHPPKAVKDHSQKVNKQERRFALRSALASGVAQGRVSVVQNVESLAKGADVAKLLSACHVTLPSRSIRAGRGKMRGRKYKTGLGPVFVVAADCPLKKSARNLSGVSVVSVRSLHAGQFMKDARVARHAVWSPEALAILTKEKLYL